MWNRLVDESDDCQERPNFTPEEERQTLMSHRRRNFMDPGSQTPLVPLDMNRPSLSVIPQKRDVDQNPPSDGPQPLAARSSQHGPPTLPNQLHQDYARYFPLALTPPPFRPPTVLHNGRGGPRSPSRRVKAHFSHNAVTNFNTPSLGFVQNLHNLHDRTSLGQKPKIHRSSVNIDTRSRAGTQGTCILAIEPLFLQT